MTSFKEKWEMAKEGGKIAEDTASEKNKTIAGVIFLTFVFALVAFGIYKLVGVLL